MKLIDQQVTMIASTTTALNAVEKYHANMCELDCFVKLNRRTFFIWKG